MVRRFTILLLVSAVAGCGGKDGNPTGPGGGSSGTRIIRLEANLDFGDVPVGGSLERFLRIESNGTEPLTVTGMTGPAGFTASWTSGTIPAHGVQTVTMTFRPTEAKSYTGTLTVQANHTSGSNTLPMSGRGQRDPFTRSGTGNTVFDMPTDVSRVKIVGTYNGNTSNFVVRVGGRLVVNELLGTFWGMTRYEGTHLVTGGVTEITNSSGVAWSIEEVR